ncbi:MAG: hypothetical protein KAR84_03235 [Elusimicrobiales bacterium]|nr:hypothetical protein [Elusimicrobiales bacterium]
MKFKKMILFAAMMPVIFSSAYCENSKVGTSGAVFLKIPASSARAQALGNCGAIIEGAESMPLNPSGIASSQMREFSVSRLSWFEDYSGQYIGYVHPVGRAVMGFGFGHYGVENFDARDIDGTPLYSDDIKVKNTFMSFTLAKAFLLERFLLGASIKRVSEDNYSKKYDNTVFDMGAMLKLGRKIIIGWSGQNFGDQKKVVQIQRLGLSLSPNPFITILAETKSYTDSKSKTGVGFEFNLPEEVLQVGKVSLRIGYTPMDDHGENMDGGILDRMGLTDKHGVSFGFGIYSLQSLGYGFGLDYSMVPYGALGKSSQISLKMQF